MELAPNAPPVLVFPKPPNLPNELGARVLIPNAGVGCCVDVGVDPKTDCACEPKAFPKVLDAGAAPNKPEPPVGCEVVAPNAGRVLPNALLGWD